MTYLPARKKRQRMGVREPSRVSCPGHLKWTRGNVCCVSDKAPCYGRIHAHHVRLGAHAGVGEKPGDDRVVSLCAVHHAELHDKGQRTFEKKYGVDLAGVAADNWRASEHGRKWRAKMASGMG